MSRVDILGVQFDALTPDEAVLAAEALPRGSRVVTPNPEIVMAARSDPELMEIINSSGLVTADGIGIIYAAKLLGRKLPGRVTGIGLVSALFERMAKRGGSVYLFGAKPGVAEKAGEKIVSEYPGINVAGTHDGYFSDDAEIIEDINRARPDLLLVCLGAPKQEKWMAARSGVIDAGLMMGLGGVLDVYAGNVKRAPKLFQKLGLEWLYRAVTQPSRFKRILKLPGFLFAALRERGREKK